MALPLTHHLKVFLMRTFQRIFTFCDLYLSYPFPKGASFTRTIPVLATSVSPPGSIDLIFYTPPGYSKKSKSGTKYPLLVNFHGGGFTIGNAWDDGRWATTVLQNTQAVVVSIGYRLAPTHPFPTGIEDCVAAIQHLWTHADEYNLDIEHTALSGFSAGGNFVYAVPIRLHEILQEGGSLGKDGKIVGSVSFYGSCDWTQTREERNASNPGLIAAISLPVFELFDGSYLRGMPDMASPLLSPGLASDAILRAALPDNIVSITCAGDQLLAETKRFEERLRGVGKEVVGHVVQGVGHAWDKWPTWLRGDGKRDEAYGIAVKGLLNAWS